MAQSVETRPGRSLRSRLAEPARSEPDWSRLFRCSRIGEALESIGGTLDRAGRWDLELTTAAGPATVVAHRRGRAGPDSGLERSATVAGDPAWLLTARTSSAALPSARVLDTVASALGAWRVARGEIARVDAGLEARTRELAMLQAIGRTAADARAPEELFAGTAAVLHEGGVIDLFVAIAPEESGPAARVFLGRPVHSQEVAALLGRAGGWLGADAAASIPTRIEPLDGFDFERGVRERLREDEVVLLPVHRRGGQAALLILVVCAPVDEGKVRIAYGAANQISVHLDRILTIAEAEEGRFRSMLESMPQAVLRTDRDLRVVHANAAATALLERLGTAGAGHRLERIGVLDTVQLAGEVLQGKIASVAVEAKILDGSVLDVTVSAFAHGPSGPGGLVFVLTDVTERRRLQSQLAQAEKLSSLGQMISGIAHELNNPLTAVVGYAQLVHAASRDEQLTRRLDTVHREALRCQKIVQNLLSFARRHEPVRQSLALNDVVEAVLALVDYQLRVGGVAVERVLDRSLPLIEGDPHELQQALLNLVTNAHHAVRTRGGGTVSVRTQAIGSTGVMLEVEDDGPGVPEEIRSRIFDPFFTTKAAGQGTGLGLSIVYGIVHAHGGAIRVENRSSGGARFCVELPAGRGGEPRAAVGEASTAVGEPRCGRILVVDDEEPVARLICEALAEDGHDAAFAFGHREALERLAAERFDLIISDIRMPGRAAEGLCDDMDRIEAGLSRRLLLTTGDTLSDEADAIAERAGVAILHKPFDLDELRRTVRSRLAAHPGRGSCAP